VKYFKWQGIYKLLPALFFISALILNFKAFYPGAMTWDSLEQLRQARLGEYADWHPPMMAFLWHFFLELNDGPGLMLLFHMTMLMLASIFFYSWSVRNKHRWSFLFLSIPFLPWILNFEFVIWKDVGLAYSWALAVAMAIFFKSKNKFPIPAAIAIFSLFLYGFLIRANSISGGIFLLPFLASCVFKKKSKRFFLLCSLFSLMIFLAAPKAMDTLLNPEKTHPFSYLMFDDLAALKLREKDIKINLFKEEDIATLHSCEFIRQHKVGAPFCINERFEEIRKYRYSELTTAWLAAISENPGEYLSYRLEAFAHLVRLPNEMPYLPSEFTIVDTPYEFNSPTKEHSIIAKGVIKFVDVSIKILPIIYKPHFWILLSIFLFFGFVLRKNVWWVAPWPLLPLSGLTYILAYLPATPADDFRYIYYSCLICTISAIIYVNIAHTKDCNDNGV